MSLFDQLLNAVVNAVEADRRGGVAAPEILVAEFDRHRIVAALEAARQGEGKPLPEQYTLPDYAGNNATLRIDGVEVGAHGLIILDGETCYQAVTGVDGVTPPLQLRARRWFLPSASEEELVAFGDVQATGERRFDRAFQLRATSRAAAVAFLTPALVEQLMRVGDDVVSITLRPDQGRTWCEVRVEVRGAPFAAPAIALARAAHAATEALVRTPGGFVATGQAHVLAVEEIQALVERVRDSVSFLAGHVARVGDGVEARVELDEPAGLHAVLRVEPLAPRTLGVSMRAELRLADGVRRTTLTPEVGALQRMRGLVDPRVGDPVLDRAFVIDGDPAVARLALADPSAALRLAGQRGCITIDGAGLEVRVPAVPHDGAMVLEVALAALACWREAALAAGGFSTVATER